MHTSAEFIFFPLINSCGPQCDKWGEIARPAIRLVWDKNVARRKCQRASRRSLNFCLRHQQPTSHQLTGTYLPIVVAMPYRKGKRQLSAQPKSRRNLKQRGKDASLSQLMNSTQSPDSNCTRHLPLRGREAHGMIPVSEEQIRTYIDLAQLTVGPTVPGQIAS